MLDIAYNEPSEDNSLFKSVAEAAINMVERPEGMDNIEWINKAIAEQHIDTSEQRSLLLLVGGDSRISRRIRSAQARLRTDLMPSWWSHAALIAENRFEADTGIYEISLEPPQGFGFVAPNNGIQAALLDNYSDNRISQDATLNSFPNIALLSIPVALADTLDMLERLRKQRLQIDLPALIVPWLSWAWGVTSIENPVLAATGLPGSVMLQVIFSRLSFDLTPGIESRLCCPEMIWQSALWWEDYHQQASVDHQGISGAYFAPHSL